MRGGPKQRMGDRMAIRDPYAPTVVGGGGVFCQGGQQWCRGRRGECVGGAEVLVGSAGGAQACHRGDGAQYVGVCVCGGGWGVAESNEGGLIC